MIITDIRIRRLDSGRLKAAASVTFDNELVVHDIKIIEGQDKRFLAMPSKKLSDGTYIDLVHPINKDMRAKIESAVLDKYQAIVEEEGVAGTAEEGAE